ncbi:MAG: hypothetical protein Q9N34_08270 [Aquificota bacterium]|nr:hypothetical protein [Aquificota bacterium]
MANSSQIEGLVVANSLLEGVELTNNSNITLNIDLINQLIKDYGLADYFKELKCEGGRMKVAGLFIMSVY